MKLIEFSVFDYHSKLNSKFWMEGDQLKVEVAEKLRDIAQEFYEYLEVPNLPIIDIILTGSNANYNYTEYSDLDLHLIVDFKDLSINCPGLAKNFFETKKSLWNKTHEIKIFNSRVELYVQDADDVLAAEGIYSLFNEKWLSKPVYKMLELHTTSIITKSKYWTHEIKQLLKDKTTSIDSIDKVLSRLYEMRRSGLETNGEFSTENICFKIIRNLGLLDKLKKFKNTLENDRLSL